MGTATNSTSSSGLLRNDNDLSPASCVFLAFLRRWAFDVWRSEFNEFVIAREARLDTYSRAGCYRADRGDLSIPFNVRSAKDVSWESED